MTKKSKTRSKVTTSSSAIEPTEETNSDVLLGNSANGTFSASSSTIIKNGKVSSSQTSTSGFNSVTSLKPRLPNISGSNPSPSLASIPGIVDDFLAPKFVKVLNLRDHGYEKTPPPSLEEYKAAKAKTDSNANKVDISANNDKESPSAQKKNKRKKSKPVKNTNSNTSYDSEDGRELDVLNSSYNGNGNGSRYDDDQLAPSHYRPSRLGSGEISSLAGRLRNIRRSAFGYEYEGNNIVLVSNSGDEGAQYPTTSSYDDSNYSCDADDDLTASGGGGPGSTSAPSDETSTLEEDEEERAGSWSLSHGDNGNGYSKLQASSSIASSESENTTSSLPSATASNPSTTETEKDFPLPAPCTSIWNGAITVCEIRDCSQTATLKCNLCKNAFYCSEEHQRDDWERHKKYECIPYQMQTIGDDVSVAVASKDIPQGQTIFTEKPLLAFALADPDNDFLNVMDLPCILKLTNSLTPKKVERLGLGPDQPLCKASRPACLGCLKSSFEAKDMYVEVEGARPSPPRSFCGSCKLPLCSYKCYMDVFHQAAECQVVASQGGWMEEQHKCLHNLYMDIEILRALQLECIDNANWQRFLHLKQNLRVEAYKNSKKYQRFIKYYRELVPISAKISGYHDDLIGNVHAIITALSFRPSLKSPYKLLFTTQILFGHDCIPNTFHYLEDSLSGSVTGLTLVTKAAVPICEEEMITIDFSPTPFLYYPLRRMVLQNVLSIDNCGCKRCRNPGELNDHTADIRCPRCRGLIYPENATRWKNSVWACNVCLEEFSYIVVVQITKECREELASILRNSTKAQIVPALQQFIVRREDQELNPGHSIILQAWSFIESYLRPSLAATRLPGPAPRYSESSIEDYRVLKRCCEAIEEHLAIIRPGLCYERGCMYLNRYYVELAVKTKCFGLRLTNRKQYILELMQCMKMLQEALKIFQVYEGYNRDVAFRIQEATSAIVTTKSFIREQILTDNEDTKNRNAIAAAAAASSTAALFRENL